MRGFVRVARAPSQLSSRLYQRLNWYALAAGTAGVLASVGQSEAKIIYTSTHQVIGNGGSYRLDLNHDGLTDLTLQNEYFHTCSENCRTSENLTAKLARNNQVVYNDGFGAVALKPGMGVGPKRAFRGGVENMANLSNGNSLPWGSWINVKNRYLGVKFKIKGEVHYGWARLSVQVQPPITITAIVTGYAYETIPDKPIIAGKTKSSDETGIETSNATLSAPLPTLGMFALGSSGLSIWRRDELAGSESQAK